jgi:membrane protease YdiL (CAAX protease family)
VWPRAKPVLVAVGCTLLLVAANDALTYLLGRPIVPQFMTDVYKTAGSRILLFVAIIIAAPVGEEALFRGFLFKGIAESWAGPITAVILTSAAWTLLHLQYDLYQMSLIFVSGLFLATVRQLTGSTLLTMLLHAINNLVATLEVIVKTELFDK